MERTLTARRVAYAVVAASLVLLTGTIGFHEILDETWLQAVYRTVVTTSLTGIDTVPGKGAGLVLSIALVFAGVTIFAFIGVVVVEAIARGVLAGAWAERRRRRTIDNLRDHTIICGYGRVGQRIAESFRSAGAPFIVVDNRPEALEAAEEAGDLAVEGNAIEDADLASAGLARARALIAALDSDTDNLYIALSARSARPDLLIVARASDEDAERKLRLAGADRVVTPYSTAGRVMAGLVLKPQVAAFLNVAVSAGGPDLRFEQIEIPPGWPSAGKALRELRIHEQTGASIVALSKQGGEYHTRPSADSVLDEGDVLIGVGTSKEIQALEDFFAPSPAGVS